MPNGLAVCTGQRQTQTATSYLGFRLAHPFIAPLEEQITLSHQGRIHHMDPLDREFAAALADFPAPDDYSFSSDAYAEDIRRRRAGEGDSRP